MWLSITEQRGVPLLWIPLQSSQDQPCSICKTANSHSSSVDICSSCSLIRQFMSGNFAGKPTDIFGLSPGLMLFLFGSLQRRSSECHRVNRPAVSATLPPDLFDLPTSPVTLQLRQSKWLVWLSGQLQLAAWYQCHCLFTGQQQEKP